MKIRSVYTFLLVTLVSVALSSCHKDTGDAGPRLVSSMQIDGNPCVITCLYDDQKRVTSVVQCDTVESYTYFTDSVVYLRTVSNGFLYKYTYTLDAKGIATGYTKIASDGSVTVYTYTYDMDGNRTSTSDITHGNTFVNTIIQNNDAVYDSSVSVVIGSGNYTIRRTYYANTENTIAYANFGKAFLGSSSANFKKTESLNTIDGQFVIKYTYELDPQNGVALRIMKVNDSIVESRTYEYYGSD